MDKPIGLTPNDLIALLLCLCSIIVTVSAAVTVVLKVIQKAHQPEKSQNERLDELEKKVAIFEEMFNSDAKRIKELEDGNREIQKALLALLSHSINGNDKDKLVNARDDLQKYLIDRGYSHNEQ